MGISSEDIYNGLKLVYETKDKAGLWSFIKDVFGIEIPAEAVCVDHQAPFDFVADAFFEEHDSMVALANRSGGKTTDFAVLDATNSYLHDKCETATVGAIKPQAKRCYKFFQDWITNIDIFNEKLISSIQSMTKFNNGSTVEILTGTVAGVNAPHPQKVFLDEIDLMLWNILQESFSMAQSKDGIVGQTIMGSTRKYATGAMSRLIEEADKRGIKVYKWCIWEVVAPYPDVSALRKRIKEMFPEMPERVKTKEHGFYQWPDLISKRLKLDDEIWESQWLCRRPERGGLVYPQYQEDIYPKGNIRDWKYNPDFELFLLEDYGSGKDHPDVVLLAQVIDWEKPILQVFDELYFREQTTVAKDVVEKVIEKLREHGIEITKEIDHEDQDRYNFSDFIEGWIGDPAGLSDTEDRKRYGAPMMEKVEDRRLYLVKNRISFVRKLFRELKILVSPRCVSFRKEVKSYSKKRLPGGKYSDVPQKKNDHGPDALGYGTVRLFPVEALGSFGVELDEELEESTAPITKGLMGKSF